MAKIEKLKNGQIKKEIKKSKNRNIEKFIQNGGKLKNAKTEKLKIEKSKNGKIDKIQASRNRKTEK